MERRHRVRFERPNQARYLTCSCHGRLPLFGNDAIKDSFAEHLAATRLELGFKLFAWVVMPEHIHLLILPHLPHAPVPRVLRQLKEPFAREVLARWRELDARILHRLTDPRGRTRFWLGGGGYDRNILDGHELPEKINYIHLNPVRRGLVERPEQWRWSSASWYTPQRSGIVPIDPITGFEPE